VTVFTQAPDGALQDVEVFDGREVLRFPAQRDRGIGALSEKEMTDLRALPGKQCYGT